MNKIQALLILLSIFIAGNSLANINFIDEAKKMSSDVNSNINQQYLQEAKDIAQNQKSNKFIQDSNFISQLNKVNEQIFNSTLTNQRLKQIFPSLNIDSLNKKVPRINQLMIFVSASMPVNSLKFFAVDSNKAGGVLVLRGLINNSFKETTAFIKALNDKGTRAIIDPKAFNLFAVNKVPEIVVIADNNQCQWGRCVNTPLFDKISGNITLEYALKEISLRGEFTKKEASRFLNYLYNGGRND